MNEYHTVQQTFFHSQYNPDVSHLDYDIGYVRTASSMGLYHYSSVCINSQPLEDLKKLSVYGWGVTENGDNKELKHTTLIYIKDHPACSDYQAVIQGRVICLINKKSHIGNSDSGSPAFFKGGKHGCAYSIVSLMTIIFKQNNEGTFMLATNLAQYKEAIIKTTRTIDEGVGSDNDIGNDVVYH